MKCPEVTVVDRSAKSGVQVAAVLKMSRDVVVKSNRRSTITEKGVTADFLRAAHFQVERRESMICFTGMRSNLEVLKRRELHVRLFQSTRTSRCFAFARRGLFRAGEREAQASEFLIWCRPNAEQRRNGIRGASPVIKKNHASNSSDNEIH